MRKDTVTVEETRRAPMRGRVAAVLALALGVGGAIAARGGGPGAAPVIAGADSCRGCHAPFHDLWASSHHGRALQPYADATDLPDTVSPVRIGESAWSARRSGGRGVVTGASAGETRTYEAPWVMGGKNVLFLLTPRERGRLQVLPIAYDVRARTWYDTTASMVRHAGRGDEPLDWTDPRLTFNTSCWSCHVSRLTRGYDPATDTYDSRWDRGGIDCETCHGPAGEHVRVCREARASGAPPPRDLAITRWGDLTAAEQDDLCLSCHAKARVIADRFAPGDRFYDCFDPAALEDPDFFPDGRDRGETYTFAAWRMSPCVRQGRLGCVHCHTSSGRYRFPGSNDACLPCHEDRVADGPRHTHHPAGGPASLCVSCHMPTTTFARMRRSDHSMRPPAPALSVAVGSPNACNGCHAERGPAWAEESLRAWFPDHDPAPALRAADAIARARARDWSGLDAMLAAVAGPGREEVPAASLIRLLVPCPSPKKVPVLVASLGDPSPLVRSSAAAALEPFLDEPGVVVGLLGALGDRFRLVRIRAAGALLGIDPAALPPGPRRSIEAATSELVRAIEACPDPWRVEVDLAHVHERRGEIEQALAAYERALRLRPEVTWPRAEIGRLRSLAEPATPDRDD